MRQLARALLSVGLLLLFVPTAMGGETIENAKDVFTKANFSGSDGTLDWAGKWEEIGESDGPAKGMVRAVSEPENCPEGSNCLLIEGGGLLKVAGAKRFVDVSDLEELELSYKLKRYDNSMLSLDPPVLRVEVTADGENWSEVASYELDMTDESYIYESVWVDEWASAAFGIRFRVVDILLASEEVGVFIDYVEVSGIVAPPPTSTTTTSSTTTTTTLLPPITTTTLPDLLSTTTTSTSTTTTTTTPATTTTSSSTTTTTTTTVPGGGSGSDSGAGAGTSGTSTGGGGASTGGDSSSELEAATGEGSATGSSDGVGFFDDPGVREASLGIQAGFDQGRFGSLAGPQVLSFDVEPNFATAVEVIESSWIWLLGLLLLIAAAIVSSLDHRRLKKARSLTV